MKHTTTILVCKKCHKRMNLTKEGRHKIMKNHNAFDSEEIENDASIISQWETVIKKIEKTGCNPDIVKHLKKLKIKYYKYWFE